MAKFTSSTEDSRFIQERRTNIKSDLIEITEDKLENILTKHLGKLRIRREWITPVSLIVAVLLALLTCTFNKKFGFEGHVWEALFLLIFFLSVIYLIYSIIQLFRFWKYTTIENLLRVVKNAESEEQFKKIKIKNKISTSELKNLCYIILRQFNLLTTGLIWPEPEPGENVSRGHSHTENGYFNYLISKNIHTFKIRYWNSLENNRYIDLESNNGEIIASLNLPQIQTVEILRLLEEKS